MKLAVKNLRLERYGHEVVSDATFELHEAHALIVGAPAALFAAVVGAHDALRGELRVGARLIHGGAIAAYPPRWTGLEWLQWRLRLAGVTRRVADNRVHSLLRELDLESAALKPLGKAEVALRRVLPLVAALAEVPDAPDAPIVFDDAFVDLPDELAAKLASTFVRLAGDTPWVGFVPLPRASSPIAAAAREVVWFEGGRVVAQGGPELLGGSRTFVVRVVGTELPWPERLAESGVRLIAQQAWVAPEGVGTELELAFDEGRSPRDLFALTAASTDVIIELFATTPPA